MADLARGDVWLVELDPTRGHEQAGRRPALIVSVDTYNRGPSGLAIVLPLTSRLRDIPLHVRVAPPEGGLTVTSAILCDQVRTITRARLVQRWGTVEEQTLRAVEERLRAVLGL